MDEIFKENLIKGVVAIIICFIVLCFFDPSIIQKSRHPEYYYIKQESELSGRIVSFDSEQEIDLFCLEGEDAKEHYAKFNEKETNTDLFREIVKRGDSIFKPAYSDTLELIKPNGIHYYFVIAMQ